jgi:ankyrin repeat protein
MKRASHFSCALLSMALLAKAGTTAETLFQAIRSGDLDALRHLSKDSVNVLDRLDWTPLHYAALYGNTESVRILLDRGADFKARNKSQATPLIYAAYNFDKTRLLVEKGADVNAQSKSGMTPLLIATSVYGNTATVRYLLEKGADINAVSDGGADALQTAAYKGDAEMVRLLLAKGADPHRADQGGYTALLNALQSGDPTGVRMLIDAGSDVNAANTFSGTVKNGPIDLVHLTPVFLAAPDSGLPVVKALLAKGARADEPDQRKFTPLMAALACDQPKLDNIRALIAAGADVNAKDRNGESVLDWALKTRNPEVLAILKQAGAQPAKPFTAPQRPADFVAGSPREAAARSSALLLKTEQKFFPDGGGCVGCHHQPLGARAYAALRAANSQPDERLRRIFLDGVIALRPRQLSGLPLLTASGGDFDGLLAQTQALADLGEPASPSTDAIVHYLAARQTPSGAWELPGNPRPPLESSNFSRTAMAIRALKTYGWPARHDEFEQRIARGRAWLLAAKPVTCFDEADRIMGLKAAGVPDSDLEKSVHALLAEQASDGGWSQNGFLDSDAYATGMVLSTLYQNGFLKPSDPAYTRGVAFLLKTQFPDGSWYVRSRGPKLQPYFQSGFPFDHDQWISAAATSFAVMALAPAQ